MSVLKVTNVNLYHRRLGDVCVSLLRKRVSGDPVHDIPKLKFREKSNCDAYVKEKQTGFSFTKNRGVSTTMTLEHLHMDLCEPVRI